eukprot:1149468-Pelagomonas_calceolata.AAC.1
MQNKRRKQYVGKTPASFGKRQPACILYRCGERDTEDSEEMLAEVYKVLQPGGVYLQLTHAEPCSRLRLHEGKKPQRPQSPWACVEVWEVGHTGTSHGPYPIKEGLDPDILPTKRELFSHWFYACKKAG